MEEQTVGSARGGGKMARNKGRRGEQEVVKLLQPLVDAAFAMAREHYSAWVGEEMVKTGWTLEKTLRETGLATPQLIRNLNQAHSGGHDIHGLKWLALEVKRQENVGMMGSWWAQTLTQAGKCGADAVPVLMHRQNGHREWRVRLLVDIEVGKRRLKRTRVDINEATFLIWFTCELKKRLGI